MEIPKRFWVGIVVLGACARLLPHPWNFTPMMAIGLFAGNHSRKTSAGILTTMAALALSDAVMGFYSGFWYVYAATLIPVLLGRLIRNRSGMGTIITTAFASSLSFFLITNFMVWVMSKQLYPHTIAGLMASYVAGIPFYQNQVLGDAFYTLAMFGGYALLSRFLKPSQETV
jgi:hypothetical protein